MGTVLHFIPAIFDKMKWISCLMMIVLMTLFDTNVTYGAHQTQERHIRAPFNGMRGKRAQDIDDDYHQINRWLLKRAPFNGMRVKRGGRAPGAGFVGMRG